MKTKTLIGCLTIGLLALGQPVRLAANPASVSSHTASYEHRRQTHEARRPATFSARDASGLTPRVIRGGNPMQMLNPLAPAKYGTADESVSLDPDVPGKVNGIKFLSISF